MVAAIEPFYQSMREYPHLLRNLQNSPEPPIETILATPDQRRLASTGDRNEAYAGRAMIKKEYPTTVADIMTTDVTTVNPHQTLADALALLRIHLFHHLLVVDAEEKLVGVLSDRDLLGAVARARDLSALEIGRIMTPRPFTVAPECSLALAASEMVSKKINCLPVVNDDQMVVGIVTSTDLLRSYQRIVEAMSEKLQQIGFIEFSLEGYSAYAPSTNTKQ